MAEVALITPGGCICARGLHIGTGESQMLAVGLRAAGNFG